MSAKSIATTAYRQGDGCCCSAACAAIQLRTSLRARQCACARASLLNNIAGSVHDHKHKHRTCVQSAKACVDSCISACPHAGAVSDTEDCIGGADISPYGVSAALASQPVLHLCMGRQCACPPLLLRHCGCLHACMRAWRAHSCCQSRGGYLGKSHVGDTCGWVAWEGVAGIRPIDKQMTHQCLCCEGMCASELCSSSPMAQEHLPPTYVLPMISFLLVSRGLAHHVSLCPPHDLILLSPTNGFVVGLRQTVDVDPPCVPALCLRSFGWRAAADKNKSTVRRPPRTSPDQFGGLCSYYPYGVPNSQRKSSDGNAPRQGLGKMDKFSIENAPLRWRALMNLRAQLRSPGLRRCF